MLGILFWVIAIIALVFGFWAPGQPQYARYAPWPMFVLIVILGFAVFGFHLTR